MKGLTTREQLQFLGLQNGVLLEISRNTHKTRKSKELGEF